MRLERYTQKQRREIMEEHGHSHGVAIEFFGGNGKTQVFVQAFGSEEEMAAFLQLHTDQMESRSEPKAAASGGTQ